MRYRLHTLLIVMGVMPMLIGAVWWILHDPKALDDTTALGQAVIALAMLAAVVGPVACLVCLLAGAFVKKR